MTKEEILKILAGVIDPNTGKNLVESGEVSSVEMKNGAVSVELSLDYPAKSQTAVLEEAATRTLEEAGAGTVFVRARQNIIAHKVQPLLRAMPNVKNIIAVSSGKGGVGKSTVAANLALALAQEGAVVGVLDADIHGPSQPIMLGAVGQHPYSTDGETMNPIESLGLQINSIGFMIDPDDPIIWRGPMLTSALKQLLTQTAWQGLDYLVIDMPPGTGDVQLTISQEIPVSGAIIVTTPQDIAAADARKGLVMFRKVNIPVLGIVENMAYFKCPHCGKIERIFGEGGAQAMSEKFGVPVLGSLPLATGIREQADSGLPTVAADPESESAAIFRDIARKAAGRLSQEKKDFSSALPKIKPAEPADETPKE